MSPVTQFNPLPLLSVKSGLGGSLDQVGQHLEQYFSAPATGQDALHNAVAELHRVYGVLRMISLDGVAVYCAEIEKVLQEFTAGGLSPSPANHEIIQRSLLALTYYLAALADGASNVTLRLFHQYQELQQARGVEMAFEVDLFFPELRVELPPSVLNVPLEPDPQARIKAARAQYQKSLLNWLRQTNPAEALHNMRMAIQPVMACVPQGERRAFWWIAAGLVDCLINDGLPPELNARGLFGRIDRQMKALLEGAQVDTYAATCEMLYLLARSHSVSEMVDSIKQTYALDDYLPQQPSRPPSETGQVLNQMRGQLAMALETWEKCSQNDDAQACKEFIEQTNQLLALGENLDRNTLQALCGHIHTIAQHCDDLERAHRVAQEMAMALLLLDSGINQYSHLGSSFHEQARILGRRLQASMMCTSGDTGQFTEMVALHSQMEEQNIMLPLTNEMQANLQYVEQALNTFFSDPSKRDDLDHPGRLLHQVLAAMYLLSLEQGVAVLHALKKTTADYAAGGNPTPAEMRAFAIALSALQEYVRNLAHGQKLDVAQLEIALQGVLAARPSATPAAIPATPAAASPALPTGGLPAGWESEDLREVFLEEAQEVLEMLRANLEISLLHPDSREPLITIRRGFHTLKGSSRMVGLTDFGEVAWATERAMNKSLDSGKPATPGLLGFIGTAGRLFQAWVDKLNKGETPAFDYTALLATALQIENGMDGSPEEMQAAPAAGSGPEPVAAPDRGAAAESGPEPSPEPIAGPTAETEVVTIGTVCMSPMLFTISTEEAAQHVAALKNHLAALRACDPPAITYDFMRAAHTLAGVNRTMGFVQVAELAYALESWLLARMDKPFTLNEMQLALLDRVISTLDNMDKMVIAHQEPQAQPELITQLQADKLLTPKHRKSPQPVLEEPAAAQQPPAPPVPAERSQTVESAKETHTVQDDIDEDLLPVFLEEGSDLYSQLGNILRAWRAQPDDEGLSHNLQRTLHTLKGGTRMVGAMRMGALTHHMEEHVIQAGVQRDTAFWNELDNYFDRIGSALDQLRSGAPVKTGMATKTGVPQAAPQAAERRRRAITGGERTTLGAMLRISPDLVDFLVNQAGEISIARSRVEVELRTFKSGLQELTGSIERLRKQLREIDIQAEGQMQARVSLSGETAEQFDPLEFDRFTQFQDLTRSMNESVHDVQTVQQALSKNLDETATALSSQSNYNRELQEKLMAIRMVPFSSIGDRLYRIVRQTGRELGKNANLELIGSELDLDRSMLEKMTAPFEHLLRNAMAHGLESAEERIRKGKSPTGSIRLTLRQENNEVEFKFTDDGAGLDIERLRSKAIERGLLQADSGVGESEIMQLIFSSGLSTASGVTEISGRGVGMDVVRSEINALGGYIDVFSERDKGARFVIHLPLTLAIAQTLMVQANHETYAFHAGIVEHIQQVKHLELENLYSKRQIEWNGNIYPLHNLTRMLGNENHQPEIHPYNPILLLRSGERRLAVHVDKLVGSQEVVVKNIGSQLARLPIIAGATVLGTGKVVMILNPITLAQRAASAVAASKPLDVALMKAQPLVMVVDDSLTVRKATSRMLTRAGYQVVTAKDGVDALEKLAEFSPAVMLLDIEMPRMDGFELTKRLRSDPKTRHLPIIIITSRAAEKHRLYAQELGVNAYLGKPFQEEELLEHIKFFQEEDLQQHREFHKPDKLLQQIANLVSVSAER